MKEIIVTMDLLRLYVDNSRINTWIAVFGEDTLKEVLPILDIKDFTHEEHIPVEEYARINYYQNKGFICTEKSTRHSVEILLNHAGHTWSRWEDKICDTYLTTTPYTSNFGKIVKALAKKKFPWIFEYNIAMYDFDTSSHWFYLKTDPEDTMSVKTLYIPWDAFIKGDWEGIVKSHRLYWKGYYCCPNENQKKYLPIALETPNSPVAQEFKRQMEINMKKG